jgi:hypothetical protein
MRERQPALEPVGVRAILESNDEVIGPARDDHAAARLPLSPLLLVSSRSEV